MRVSKPEEIKICDPACGSGHMLTYAFDLLYAIYEEEGYEPSEIPEKILTHNLYGVEIDERAGELAAFALTMKAREKQRRFFRKPVQPNICVLEPIRFEDGELKDYLDFVGRDLFTEPLRETLHQFREADNFGSLIRPAVADVRDVWLLLKEKDVAGQLFLYQTHQKVLKVLRQADVLSAKYHVVVANPPYMTRSNMNLKLKTWAEKEFPIGRHDLFSAFILRSKDLTRFHGYTSMVTIQNWMFLSSFDSLRKQLLSSGKISNLIQIGYNSFPELNSKVVQAAGFTIFNGKDLGQGEFFDLNSAPQSADKHKVFLQNIAKKYFYKASSITFERLPGEPIAYWVSEKIAQLFTGTLSGDVIDLREGIHTGDNERFLRHWHEVYKNRLAIGCENDDQVDERGKWVPYNKGGTYRKWYGNNELVIAWDRTSREEMDCLSGHVRPSKSLYFREGGTWSALTSGSFGIRFYPKGFLFDSKGQVAVGEKFIEIIGQFNTNLFQSLAKTIMPTLDYKCGDVKKLPYLPESGLIVVNTKSAIKLTASDWNSYETSWDFTSLPLLEVVGEKWEVGSKEETLSTPHSPLSTSLREAYTKLRAHWQNMTLEMQRLEEENNRIFIDAYGLQDELTPEVPLNEITLTCNPHYRYGGDKTEAELEALLLADTMRELVSYAVGCMFGRYALDKPGLILANQGETIEDYLQHIPEPCFPADDDNVIPMLDGDWFADDIAERFRKFLRVAFGEDHYEENLKFVEQGLNIKGKRNYSIRDYFLSEFYPDHIKRYKKRPIYWLFSSPKGTFNALIYMHRYRPDTVSIVLNDYLREFRTKLIAEKAHLEQVSISETVTAAAKTKALRDIEALNKAIHELDTYERDILYPLATEKLEIDLDDGVKVNYPKFGKALKPIPGLT